MKKLLALLSIFVVLFVVVASAEDYFYTRYDNKYATPILSALQDYRAGVHLDLPGGFVIPAFETAVPVKLFLEGGVLHELELSHDATFGIIVPVGSVELTLSYNSNTIPTLGNCATAFLKIPIRR